MKICFLLLILFVLTTILTFAQDTITVDSVTRLALPNDGSPRVFPSPDGKWVAYERAVRPNGHRDFYLCLLDTTKNADPQCDLIPSQNPRGFEPDPNSTAYPMAWSPDSTRVIVTGQPYAAQADSDMFLYTIADRSWRNLTDDAYEGGLPGPAVIETQPVWSPGGGAILAERTEMATNGSLSAAQIVFVNVIDVPGVMTAGDIIALTTVPGERSAGATTGISLSPDRETVAFSVLHRELDAENDGIWFYGLVDNSLRHFVTLDKMQEALDGVYAGLPLKSLGPLSYSPDGTKLLVWAGDAAQKPALLWAFIVDVATGEISPVSLPAQESDTPVKKSLRPIQGTWSPDGAAVLLMVPGRDRTVDEKPLDPADDSARVSVYVVNVASGTPILLGQLPLGTATGFYSAGWSADGTVVVNGYALKISGE